MAEYRLSNTAKEDLIRIHQYGIKRFGIAQADQYFDSLFKYLELIAERPFAFEAVDFIKPGYRRCVCSADTIYFKVSQDRVDIMTIFGRQDLRDKLSDLPEEE